MGGMKPLRRGHGDRYLHRTTAALPGAGQACPAPESKNKNLPDKERVSDMCPV